jgi:hypothetical protein
LAWVIHDTLAAVTLPAAATSPTRSIGTVTAPAP